MSISPHTAIVSESTPQATEASIRNGFAPLRIEAAPITLIGERLLAADAMRLLMRLDRDLREARAQFNQDWFRRLVHVRSRAALRLRRRWRKIDPPPTIPLGNLRRRYHANLARYLYEPRDPQSRAKASGTRASSCIPPPFIAESEQIRHPKTHAFPGD
jgi:hypothetical protein